MENFITGLIAIFIIIIVFKALFSESKARRNGTRTCQWCKQKIPYSAQVCPYCRRKPGADFGAEGLMLVKLIRIAVGLCITIFLFVVVICSVAFFMGYKF